MEGAWNMTIEYKDSKRIILNEADRTLRQGFDGGEASTGGSSGGCGGGGGASAVGANGVDRNGGNGGEGISNDITASSVVYSSGGGGGSYNTLGGSGGTGGTGAGNGGGSGGAATGYGCGAGGGGVNANGSTGYQGIVILRFTTSGNGYSQAGGSVATSGSDTIITWTATSGTRTFTPTSAFDVRYLVVGGGGGSGGDMGGGAGAGGYLAGISHAVTAQAYTIVVGAGGAANSGSTANNGTSGSNSSFDTLTSTGGGYGAGNGKAGSNGGSGGGCGRGNTTVGTGTSSDVTPTDVQDNSIMVEKDTAKRYWFDVSKDTTKDGTNSNITLDTTNEKLGTGCYDFNGSTSRSVTSVKFNGLHDNTGGSISFWMRPRNMSSIHGNGDYIFDSMATSAANGTGISIAIKNTSLLRVNFTTSSNGWFTDINSTTQFANNTWYHVVMTFGSNTVKLYINGSQEDTATFSNPNTNASNGNFVIGRHSTDPSSYGYYDGLLDDTGIWNRVITSSEVTSLYNSGTGALASSISTTGFAGYYNYDAVTGGKLENETTTATWTYPPTYTGNYSSTSGWTQATTNTANSGTGSQTVGIDGGWAYANSTGSANGQFVHTSLGITLNDTKWLQILNIIILVQLICTHLSWQQVQAHHGIRHRIWYQL